MLPKVIIHNVVSLDGCVTGFEFNLETYYKIAFERMYDDYNVRVIRFDSGWTLNSILLEQGLVNEISLFVSPVLVGNNDTYLFRNIHSENSNINLELIKNEVYDEVYLLLVYKVLK